MKSILKPYGSFPILGMVLIFGTLIHDATARDEVCVYDKKDYEGEEFCTSRDIPNLGDYGWNDKISSVSVSGDADLILYEHSDYKGESIEYSGDVSRIRGGLDNEASSLRVVTGGGGTSGTAVDQNSPYPQSEGWQLQPYCSCASAKRCYVRKRNGQREVGQCVFECPNGCKN
jgi:hypothetical protein